MELDCCEAFQTGCELCIDLFNTKEPWLINPFYVLKGNLITGFCVSLINITRFDRDCFTLKNKRNIKKVIFALQHNLRKKIMPEQLLYFYLI